MIFFVLQLRIRITRRSAQRRHALRPARPPLRLPAGHAPFHLPGHLIPQPGQLRPLDGHHPRFQRDGRREQQSVPQQRPHPDPDRDSKWQFFRKKKRPFRAGLVAWSAFADGHRELGPRQSGEQSGRSADLADHPRVVERYFGQCDGGGRESAGGSGEFEEQSEEESAAARDLVGGPQRPGS